MLNNTSITLKQICFNIDSLFLLSGSLDKNNSRLNKDRFLDWASIDLIFLKTAMINNPDIQYNFPLKTNTLKQGTNTLANLSFIQ